MLGSRFDLAETLVEIAQRETPVAQTLAGASIEPEPSIAIIDVGEHCAELERQIADVARLVHLNNPKTSFKCPVCESRMRVSGERVLAEFGALDVKRHELECDTCGLPMSRAFHPSIGYHELPR